MELLDPMGPSAGEVSAQSPEINGEVRGMVRDANSGVPVAGASVRVRGEGASALTRADGSFVLKSGARRGVIQVERLGYAAATLEYDGTAGALVIELEPAALDVEGLVVTGTLTEREARRVVRPVSPPRDPGDEWGPGPDPRGQGTIDGHGL